MNKMIAAALTEAGKGVVQNKRLSFRPGMLFSFGKQVKGEKQSSFRFFRGL